MSEATQTPADAILELLGPATLIPIPTRSKQPRCKWQEITHADSERTKHNLTESIAVKVGDPSFGLISIDLDSPEALKRFLGLNPRLDETLHSFGRRGGNIWVRITGVIPKLGDLTLRSSNGHESVGEWRGTGGYTLLHGLHKDTGKPYRNNGKKVISLTLEEIVWPAEWETPWDRAERKAKEPKKEPEEPKSPEAVRALLLSIPPRPDYRLWLRLSAAVRNSLEPRTG